MLSDVKRKRDEKKKILEDQLGIIKSEKTKVDSDVKVDAKMVLLKIPEYIFRFSTRQCNTSWK